MLQHSHTNAGIVLKIIHIWRYSKVKWTSPRATSHVWPQTTSQDPFKISSNISSLFFYLVIEENSRGHMAVMVLQQAEQTASESQDHDLEWGHKDHQAQLLAPHRITHQNIQTITVTVLPQYSLNCSRLDAMNTSLESLFLSLTTLLVTHTWPSPMQLQACVPSGPSPEISTCSSTHKRAVGHCETSLPSVLSSIHPTN